MVYDHMQYCLRGYLQLWLWLAHSSSLFFFSSTLPAWKTGKLVCFLLMRLVWKIKKALSIMPVLHWYSKLKYTDTLIHNQAGLITIGWYLQWTSDSHMFRVIFYFFHLAAFSPPHNFTNSLALASLEFCILVWYTSLFSDWFFFYQ